MVRPEISKQKMHSTIIGMWPVVTMQRQSTCIRVYCLLVVYMSGTISYTVAFISGCQWTQDVDYYQICQHRHLSTGKDYKIS